MLTRYYHGALLLLLAFCPLALMMSCQSGPDETTLPEGQCTISFSVTNYRQISFDDLSSDGTTRAVPSNHPSTLAHLLLAVFDAETGQQACTPVLHDQKDYVNKDEAYTQFSVTLPYGHYRVLVLGYNGQKACNIASVNHISWADSYVPNTFLYCEDFTLSKESEPSKDITLKHVVAAFRVMAEDVIPAELKKMRFVSTAGGTVLDATTGFTPANSGRTSDIEIPSSHIGIKDTFTVYMFLPEEQIQTNYTVQALDGDNEAFVTKHFNNVPLKINYLTEWKGKLFEASDDVDPEGVQSGFYIEWDTEWKDRISYTP